MAAWRGLSDTVLRCLLCAPPNSQRTWPWGVQAHGTTLFTTLLAAFQVQLGRYSQQEHFAVGCPSGGRGHRSLEPLIGYLVNPLAFAADLRGNPTFSEHLTRWGMHSWGGRDAVCSPLVSPRCRHGQCSSYCPSLLLPGAGSSARPRMP